MYEPPSGPVDRLYWRLIMAQKIRFIGPIVRQLLKFRGIDIPPQTLQPGARLILRHAGNVVIHTQTTIGRDVMIHQGVTIGRADVWNEPDPAFKGFVIEDNVIVCANAVVLGRTGTIRLAQGCVIGANSVLTQSTGPWEIWAGAPARKVGSRLPVS